MGFHNICSKLDQALVDYIVAGGAGADGHVWPGKRSELKEAPCTIVCTHTARPHSEHPHTGDYNCEVYVEVKTLGLPDNGQNVDEPKQEADDRASATFDLFQTSDEFDSDALCTAINAASTVSDFSVTDVTITEITQGFNPRSVKQEGNAWIDCLHLDVQCQPSSGA